MPIFVYLNCPICEFVKLSVKISLMVLPPIHIILIMYNYNYIYAYINTDDIKTDIKTDAILDALLMFYIAMFIMCRFLFILPILLIINTFEFMYSING